MQKRHVISYLMIGIAVCLLVTPSVMAQMPQMPTAQDLTATMNEAVDLTDDQEAKVLQMYEDIMSGGMGGGMGMMMGGGQDMFAEILTEDQMDKWNAYQIKQQVDRRIATFEQFNITLTNAQKEKLVPVFEKETATRNEMMAAMMEQGPNGDMQGMMDKMTEISNATTEALGSILTEDQMKIYNDQMSQMGMGRGMGGMGGPGMGR